MRNRNKMIDKRIKEIKESLKYCGKVEYIVKLKKSLADMYSDYSKYNIDVLEERELYLKSKAYHLFEPIIIGFFTGLVAYIWSYVISNITFSWVYLAVSFVALVLCTALILGFYLYLISNYRTKKKRDLTYELEIVSDILKSAIAAMESELYPKPHQENGQSLQSPDMPQQPQETAPAPDEPCLSGSCTR